MEEKTRVLIVEDEEGHQKIFKDIVAKIGYESQIASTIGECLAKLARMVFHVALVDLSLDTKDPDNRDGFKILAHLKTAGEVTSAIVLTGVGTIRDSSTAFSEYSVFEFIAKPDMEILDVQRKIQEAAEAARIEMKRPSRLRTVTELVKGLVVSQFSEETQVTSQDLELFLRRLLGKMQPLLPDKQDASYRREDKNFTVQVRFWSRALGQPILAWFGKSDEMKVIIQAMDDSVENMQAAGYSKKVDEIFEVHSLGGAVYTLADVAFEEFEALEF